MWCDCNLVSDGLEILLVVGSQWENPAHYFLFSVSIFIAALLVCGYRGEYKQAPFSSICRLNSWQSCNSFKWIRKIVVIVWPPFYSSLRWSGWILSPLKTCRLQPQWLFSDSMVQALYQLYQAFEIHMFYDFPWFFQVAWLQAYCWFPCLYLLISKLVQDLCIAVVCEW